MLLTDDSPPPFWFFACPNCKTPIPTDLPVGYHGRCKGCTEYEYSIVLVRQVAAHTYEWNHLRRAGYPADGMDGPILVRDARWECLSAQPVAPTPTTLPPAVDVPTPAAPPQPAAIQPEGIKRRPCYDRDHLWLMWREDEKMGPAAIRDRWNREFARYGGQGIATGRPGRDVVKEGLRKAKAERGEGG